MYVMALDQGTTSSRAILFDRGGNIRSVAQRETTQHFPQPGWVEQDAGEIWETQAEVAVEALRSAGVDGSRIAAVGITNQRETTVVWDRRTGEPVGNAIVWQDRRTADACDELRRAGVEERVRARTGLLLDPYFSGTKIAWILEHVSGARERAEAGELAFGTVDSWLAFRLTGGRLHVTDATNASRTLLYDIHAGDWDDELLDLLGVPRALLPEVRGSSAVYAEIAGIHDLAGVPLAGIAGDQQSALMGQLCTERGSVKTTYGTGCFALLHTGTAPQPSERGLLTTIACSPDRQPRYALEGSVFTGGAVVRWLRDGLGLIRAAEEVEALAASVPDSGGVVLVPAFTGLGVPHWDPHARGTIVGMTLGTGAGHLARAALEGIAFQVAELLDALAADAGAAPAEMRIDGGAARNDLLMQFQADVTGLPVVRPEVTESTGLGAAYLAGLAVGYWQGVEELAGNWRVERRFEPSLPEDRVAGLRASWSRAVERAGNWAAD
ncbi:MAG: glycerol kinase GlpK [Spirochaetaceae bacterium]|nr:glycerol kinase GlpK [Spirochaetaceae bacterium]